MMPILKRLSETYQSYGPLSFLGLVRDILFSLLYTTTLNCDGFSLFRQPVYIRGGRYITIGKGFISGNGLRLDAFKLLEHSPELRIGDNVQVNDYVHVACCNSISIGNNVLIASKVFITDHNHGYYDDEHYNLHESPLVPPLQRRITSGCQVTIEDNVWIGEHVCILQGVHIGAGSIIGALSVVNGEIPAHSIAVGCPARVIKQYNFERQCWERSKPTQRQ